MSSPSKNLNWDDLLQDIQLQAPETPALSADEARDFLIASGFRSSIIDRAFERLQNVYEAPDTLNGWIVAGNEMLDDEFSAYQIVYNAQQRMYLCSCYSHAFGGTRVKKVCSHVVAVIAALRMGLACRSYTGRVDMILTIPSEKVKPATELLEGMTPRDLLLPFDEFRPAQFKIINKILKSEKKFVIVQAATGLGKSVCAVAMQRLIKQRLLYLVTTKQLQDQLMRDFSELTDGTPYGKTLKGRNAYKTLNFPELWPTVSCDVCLAKKKTHCPSCCSGLDTDGVEDVLVKQVCDGVSRCPYRIAKAEAANSVLPILNLSMFLNVSEHAGMYTSSPICVIDEVDRAEQEIMSFVEVRIPIRWARRIGLELPPRKKQKNGVDITAQTWIQWIRDTALPVARQRLEELKRSELTEDLVEEAELSRVVERMQEFMADVESGIVTETSEDQEREVKKPPVKWVFVPEEFAFKLTAAAKYDYKENKYLWNYGQDLLWSKAEKFILMTATVISVDQMARDLGIPRDDIEFIDVGSTFNKNRRPIFYMPVTLVSHKTELVAYPLIVKGLDKILDRHKNVKILCHTVSYRLAQYIMSNSQHKDRLITYDKAHNRETVLETYKKSDKPLVLVAPSMERGTDLPDDLCRVIVLCKVPWPNKGDPQVSSRLYGDKRYGNLWYTMQTVRSIVQATGRGTRHEKDFCISYILDASFASLYKDYKYLFPTWWRDSLKMKQ